MMRVIAILVLLSFIGGSFVIHTTAQDCLPTRLEIGLDAQVTPGASNRIRSQPTTDADQIGQIPAGGIFTILDGSQCIEGFRWWRVRYETITGWTVESNASDYFVEPYETPTNATTTENPVCAQETLLQIDSVARPNSTVPSRIRANPTTDADQIGQVQPLDVFVVVDGPICAGGFIWWQVEAGDVVGWVAEGDSETVFVESVTDPDILATLFPTPEIITYAMSWNADATRLAVAHSLGIYIYDTENWQADPYILAEGFGATEVLFSPTDADVIAVNGADFSPLRVYRLSDDDEIVLMERPIREEPVGMAGSVHDFTFSADGSQFAYADTAFYVLETDTWILINFVNLYIDPETCCHLLPITFSPATLDTFATYGAGVADSETVYLFDLTRPKPTDSDLSDPRLSELDRGGRTQTITALEFFPDSTYLISGDDTGSLQMWLLETGERLSFIRADDQTSSSNRINDIAVHPDGTQLVTAESDPRALLRVFSADDLAPVLTFEGEEAHTHANVVAYHPNGNLLVTIMDATLYLLDTSDYTVIERIIID